jgi:sulfite exporter TauE/SafE
MSRHFSKSSSSFALGLLSMFLPCGWLYTYVLAAAASQSPCSGALVMFLFWLGTIPALSAFPIFAKKAIALSNKTKQKVAGGILISASIYALISFYFLHQL